MTGELAGRDLGAYRLEERVGRGGMGEVYRAQHLKLGREAAVKILPANLAAEADFLKRFEREAASAASLDHPNILPVWDYGEQGDLPYLVMPFVRGGTLKERLERGPLERAEALGYLGQMAAALDYAHAHGLIHRDVKPANMLLDGRGRLFLSDFGIAKALEGAEGLTRTGVGVGTPEYMAPEQAQGHADARSDFYALGIILYQMLTGQVPYRGNSTVEVLMKHLQEPVPLLPLRAVNPALPPRIEGVIQRALAKNPNDRYQSGQALVDAASEALAAPAAGQPGTTWVPAPATPSYPAPPGATSPGTQPYTQPYAQPPPPAGGGWAAPGTPPPPGGGQWTAPAGGQWTPAPVPQAGVPPPPVAPATGRGRSALPLIAIVAAGVVVLLLLCAGGGIYLATRPDTNATATAGAAATGAAVVAAQGTSTAGAVAMATGTAGAVATATASAPTPTPVPPTATTVPPTATAVPPTPTPALKTAYKADFTTWTSGSQAGQYQAGADPATGEYRLKILKTDYGLSVYAPEDQTFGDFVLQVDAHRTAGPDAGAYGLVFRVQPLGANDKSRARYIFYVKPDGYYAFREVHPDGTETYIQDETKSPAVKQGDATNHLTVTCKGGQVTLAVNGQTVGTFQAQITSPGEIGIAVLTPPDAAGMEAAFGNLTVSTGP
ncbi:MAG TPA: protein kinase [Thermomicrobiales bacterium]|nr:protein kinase [Thermomicrobiales bacterium]